MVQDTEGAQFLWIHQESAIITADSHDVWSFTPEFLIAKGIVPDFWTCTQATRDEEEATIEYGPIHWWMTDVNLWITSYPECPIGDESRFEEQHDIVDLVKRYIEAVPHLPARSLWFFWRILVPNEERYEWLRSTFLQKEWPAELGTIESLQPTLEFVDDEVRFRMTIENEQTRIRQRIAEDTIIFECFVSSQSGQINSQILTEAQRLSDRLNTLRQAINHLLEEGGQA